VLVVALPAWLSVPAADPPANDKSTSAAESNYFPNKVGNTWTYEIGGKSVTTKIVRHEKMGDYMCAVLETMIDGEKAATEHIAVTKQGLIRVAYKDKKIEPPILFLKFNAQKGESWPIDSKIDQETVKGQLTRDEVDVEVPGYKGKSITVTS